MTTYTATYSPDDNKLRLYASSRLDAETYARVKSAGFKWAPKQELFVAPMWTPQREDLLMELAGEIGDEDKSLTERVEERADRFEDYSEKRADEAVAAKARVDEIADGIPLGQPILVGHHSEKRARKDAERIRSGMAKAVKLWDTAQYWTARAAGAVAHAKYKERPDVRARRIKGIAADKRKVEARKAKALAETALWRKTLYATPASFGVHAGDFLECTPEQFGKFDYVLMNPPFKNGEDIRHIEHARKFLKPGGRLVAICANGPRQQERLQTIATHWEELPAGTFKEAGTMVNTALVVIDGPES